MALVPPSVSTAAMSRFLAELSASHAPDAHAVLVLDQAGWHGACALVVPPNLTLVPLPPYSPELNPVERLWLYLRERYLSLRLLADCEAVVDACCAAGEGGGLPRTLHPGARPHPVPHQLPLAAMPELISWAV